MAQFKHIHNGDVITAKGAVEDHYAANPLWVRVISPDEAEELKGAALDTALEEHGLPKSGKADEKRERLVGAPDTKEQ